MKKEWYASWFDSPYYHLLYKNRDENEARRALDALLSTLELAQGARVLDLACGKGRHSRYLAEKGFDVTGLDISDASIAFARQFENEHLAFYQHDMRRSFRSNYFDAVVNFFTSFGYFDTEHEHLNTLINIAHNLKPGGVFLLDFFNEQYVRDHLVLNEEKIVEGIQFSLNRSVRNGHVYKHVAFITPEGGQYEFEERVRLFTLETLQTLLNKAGLEPGACYGDYDLSPYDKAQSKRLILLSNKTKQS